MRETSHLIASDDEAGRIKHQTSGARIIFSFMLMTTSFSLNHGAVAAVIGFAGADFKEMGSASNGVLYFAYCLTALFISKLAVYTFGLKRALIMGVGQYTLYLLCYLVAALVGDGHAVAHAFLVIGSGIGGVAAGYWWVAQGIYFSICSKQYALSMSITEKEATALLSSYFASTFLCCEVLFKLGGGVLKQHASDIAMYVSFGVIGSCSAGLMFFIDGPEELGVQATEDEHPRQVTCAACSLLGAQPKMALLLPTQFTFGFSSALINASVGPEIVQSKLGNAAIGYLGGLVAVVASAVSLIGGQIGKSTGGKKWPLMIIGGISFGMMSGSLLVYQQESFALSGIMLVYAAQGLGRGVFESTNKACIADIFAEEEMAGAFANVIWSSGGSAAAAFFLFPHIPLHAQALLTCTCALVGIISYVGAVALHSRSELASGGVRSQIRVVGAD